jgi:hypothetical protein
MPSLIKRQMRRICEVIAVLGIIGLITFALARKSTASTPPARTIDSCSATIDQPGVYTVGKPLLAHSGDCIDVNAADVVLRLDGHSIQGGHSGVGIHVLPAAMNVSLEGAGKNGPAVISGFNVGVQTDADHTKVRSIAASTNRRAGILLDHVRSADVSQSSFDNNGSTGIRILGGGGNTIANCEAVDNGTYGVWLDGTNGNNIESVYATANNQAGVYLGCANEPFGACQAGPSSDDNFLSGNIASNPNRSMQKYGIVVAQGSINNRLADNTMQSDGVKDKVDGNQSCAANSWYGNNFDTASPSSCLE